MRLPFTVTILAVGGTLAVGASLDRTPAARADRVPAARPSTSRPPSTPRDARRAYSATSPHWPQIRTMVTDFRTGYVTNGAQRSAEREWTAGHFDFVMGGDAQGLKSVNSTIRVIPYALDWNVMQPGEQKSKGLGTTYYDDMQQWYSAHPQYQLEKAFLHIAGSDPSESSRLQFVAWGSKRWAINPGDPGARAYLADRIQRFVADADGVFFDSHSSGDIGKALGKTPIAEYPDRQVYQRDMVDYVQGVAKAIAPKVVMINTSEYMKPFDFAMATAAGSAHLERVNNPLNASMTERWAWVDSLLAHNVLVELVTLDSWDEANNAHGTFATFTPGDFESKAERLKMFELASYYLVVPQSPDRLFLDLQNNWKVPYDKVWLKAQEYPVGHPTGPRRVLQTGRDSTGNGFQIWAREFDHALILARPNSTWKNKNYGDGTAVTVQLPDGQALRPLRGDGTLGNPVTSITLRNSEAAILVR
ncbi:MAG TPA: hypothetical protein VIC24_14530 [Gemmatimonadaceae bacterium]|jgi:hypothetical protein